MCAFKALLHLEHMFTLSVLVVRRQCVWRWVYVL